MEKAGRKLLTDEQAWNDLQYVNHTRGSITPVLILCGLLVFSVLTICVGQLIPGVVMLAGAIVVLSKMCKKPAFPAWNPNNPNALIYDMDVCVDRIRKYDSEDAETYYEAVYEKAGHIRNAGMFSAGYPSGDDTQIGDRFFTVRLQDNPKIVQYYSCKEWYLGEIQED